MKRKELEKVIEHHTAQLEKYALQIPGSFAVADIHELRVEYKKIRAFLRLLFAGNDEKKLMGKLEKMYKAAGRVRDLQLFLPLLPQNTQKKQPLPRFIQCLHQQLFEAKEQLVKEIEKIEWHKVTANIKKFLPAVMDDNMIQQFVHRKVASINVILLAIETEKDLHLIRKHLKDLVHNIKIFRQHWGISFPATAWKSEKMLNDIAAALGDFNDLCISAGFFNSCCMEIIPGEEKKLVKTWEGKWLQQKEETKKQLIPLVKKQQLTHSFKVF